MSKALVRIVGSICIAVLAACGSPQSSIPTITVGDTDTEFRVPAKGELITSESIPITVPGSVRMRFNIAWIVPEFSEVRAGDVIARFDDVQMRLDRDTAALAVVKSEFKLANTERSGGLERTRIDHEASRVEGERDISETFASVDERMMSRNEMIDALSDLDFLDAEAAFLEWQMATFGRRTDAEENLIRAERQTELSKLNRQESALQMTELRSPADGTFVYARTPWGEKVGKGKSLFSGMPVGLLPVRGKVNVRLYIPETDAVGLAEGQIVRFRLDSATDREFGAKIVSISPVASPRHRNDPQRFFTIEAAIDEIDADLMRVGSRLRADIVTGTVDKGIVVPARAVHDEADGAYVYVVDGSRSERRRVEIGLRSPDLVELTAGIDPGERVSLLASTDAS